MSETHNQGNWNPKNLLGGACGKCGHVHISIVCTCGCDISGDLLKVQAEPAPQEQPCVIWFDEVPQQGSNKALIGPRTVRGYDGELLELHTTTSGGAEPAGKLTGQDTGKVAEYNAADELLNELVPNTKHLPLYGRISALADALNARGAGAGQDEALRNAVRELYYAAVWHADRPVDEAGLWTAVRDAAGFEPGNSPRAARAADAGERDSWNSPKGEVVCAARHSDTGANDPQDCDWPICGCDRYADKVIAALQESTLYRDPREVRRLALEEAADFVFKNWDSKVSVAISDAIRALAAAASPAPTEERKP